MPGSWEGSSIDLINAHQSENFVEFLQNPFS